MSTEKFKHWISNYDRTQNIAPLELGMTIENVEDALGSPDKFDLFWEVDMKPREMVYSFVRLHFTAKSRLLYSICDDRTETPSVIAADLNIELADS